MVMINLMPWRDRRQRRQWQKWRLLGGLMPALILLVMQDGYWQQRLNHQHTELLRLWPVAQQAVAALHQRTLAAQKRLDQMKLAQQQQRLQQQDLIQWSEFIQRLIAEIPQDVWLSGLKKHQQSVSLRGFSRSIAGLHHFRDRLHQPQKIPSVKLGALRREPTDGVSFSMQIMLGSKHRNNE